MLVMETGGMNCVMDTVDTTREPESSPMAQAAELVSPTPQDGYHILVIGPTGCGKSSLAAALAQEMGQDVAETSDVLIYEIAVLSSLGLDRSYEDSAKLYRPKSSQARRVLLGLGDLMTRLQPDCLLRDAAMLGSIVCGARRREELAAWFADRLHFGDVLIEILGAEDAAFTAKGFECREIRGLKFIVTPGEMSWESWARELAAEIRLRRS